MGFVEKLNGAIDQQDSLLCVGLDPDPAKLPECVRGKDNPVLYFVQQIVDATADLVCAFKPNFAFYGALGADAWPTLKALLEHIPPTIPVILDAKVGDIGSTAERYAQMFFGELAADALTVNPYMGRDAVEPFLAYGDKGIFLLCLTSNPGADDFEKQQLADGPLYRRVAVKVGQWNSAGNCGLVVGGTQTEEIAQIRALAPEMPFLMPGIGAQGGDVEAAVSSGQDQSGRGLVINTSRAVLYASSGDDFASAARSAAEDLRDQINRYRQPVTV